MKINHSLLTFIFAAPTLLASCSGEKEFDLTPSTGKAQGTLILNLAANADFPSQTRAVDEEAYKNTSNYNVRVYNAGNDNIVVDCNASELADNLPKTIQIGSYRIEAKYGEELPASRDQFLMYGTSTITLKAQEEKTVNIACTPTCGKVAVTFDSEMATYYNNYSVKFGGTEALGGNTIDWSKTDSEPWYIALKEEGETIHYTIDLEVKEDYMHKEQNGSTSQKGSVTGSFHLDRNKAHRLTIKPNYTPTTEGGMTITITIDESTNDHEITWDVPVTWI